jgi:hypothetical protein
VQHACGLWLETPLTCCAACCRYAPLQLLQLHAPSQPEDGAGPSTDPGAAPAPSAVDDASEAAVPAAATLGHHHAGADVQGMTQLPPDAQPMQLDVPAPALPAAPALVPATEPAPQPPQPPLPPQQLPPSALPPAQPLQQPMQQAAVQQDQQTAAPGAPQAQGPAMPVVHWSMRPAEPCRVVGLEYTIAADGSGDTAVIASCTVTGPRTRA